MGDGGDEEQEVEKEGGGREVKEGREEGERRGGRKTRRDQ